MRDPKRTPLVYLDSMVFIYALEGEDSAGPAARTLFAELRKDPGAAMTSELSLAEVLAPTRLRGAMPATLSRAYFDLMIRSGVISLEPVSRTVLVETATVRKGATLKLPDAIHLTTAIRAGCTYFVTKDIRIAVPEPMTKVEPDRNGVERILKSLT
jgi:predicted nucleic acid-binding protein